MNSDNLTYVVAVLLSAPVGVLVLGMLFRRITRILS